MADKTHSPLLDAALAYAAKGWHVFPVWGGDGKGKCRCGRLCKSPGKHPVETMVPRGQDDATTDPETIRRWWAARPNAGIAVNLRLSGLVVVDIDPRNGGFETKDAIEDQYGKLESDVQAFTQQQGEHFYYLLATEDPLQLPGKLGPGIDLKRNGYVVMPPSLGVAGAYDWEISSDPLDGAIPHPLPDWIRNLSKPIEAPTSFAATSAARFIDEKTAQELAEALTHIDADDRDTWVKIGHALRMLGQVGLDLWTTWSKTSHKFDPVDQLRVWRSFAPHSLNYETVFYHAMAHGWANTRHAPKPEPEDYRDAMARAQMTPVVTELGRREAREFPVDGLNALAAWLCEHTGASYGIPVQMATLAVAGLAASRLYETPQGDGCNLHQLIAAQSYAEMGPLLNAVGRLFHDAGLRRLVREQRLSSPMAFFRTLYRCPASLYIAGDWGRKFFGPQFAAVEHVGILIGQGYNKPSWVLDSPEEAGLKKSEVEDEQPIIHKPSMNLLAFAAESDLTNVFSESAASRGLLETLLFARVEVDYPYEPAGTPAPGWLTNHIRAIRGLPEGDRDVPLSSLFNGSSQLIPTTTMVRFDAAPEDYYPVINALSDQRHHRTLLTGARTTLRKLACTLAVFRNPHHAVIDKPIMDWATQFVAGSTFELLQAAKAGAGEDGKSSAYDKVLTVIAKAGAEGIKGRELQRHCRPYRNLNKEGRDSLLAQLLEDGEIMAHPTSKAYVLPSLIKVEYK